MNKKYQQWESKNEKQEFLKLLDIADEKFDILKVSAVGTLIECPLCKETINSTTRTNKDNTTSWSSEVIRHMINNHNAKPDNEFVKFVKECTKFESIQKLLDLIDLAATHNFDNQTGLMRCPLCFKLIETHICYINTPIYQFSWYPQYVVHMIKNHDSKLDPIFIDILKIFAQKVKGEKNAEV